jgi:hypothetical protein
MAEVKAVKVTGEELERRIRVELEYRASETEPMLNAEVLKQIAVLVAKEYYRKNKAKLLSGLSVSVIQERVLAAIARKAVFDLATEGL